jgi:hypothetical protein
MKRIFQNFGKVVLAIALVAAAGCRKEDTLRFLPGENGEPSDYEVVDAAVDASAKPSGIYLVNQGNQGSNKARLDFLNFHNGFYIRDVFTEYNPEVVKGLGDTGNDVQVYKGKVFVVVNGSHKVEIMDAYSMKRLAQVDIPNCRFIAFDGNCAYVTSYVAKDAESLKTQKGALYCIDLDTYKVTGQVTVGYQPEQLVIMDGKAYVANSGGYVAGYDDTVSVVDLKSMKVEYDIKVAINLGLMLVDAEGTIWVSSQGNFSDVSSTLNYLVKKGDKYELGGSVNVPVSSMALAGDKIYVIGTTYIPPTWKPTTTYNIVNVKTRKLESGSFITDGTESDITTAYTVTVNPGNGDIYVTDAKDYVSSGTLHCYTGSGKHKWSVRTGDIPDRIAFL